MGCCEEKERFMFRDNCTCGKRAFPELVEEYQGTRGTVPESQRNLIQVNHESRLRLYRSRSLTSVSNLWYTRTFETDSRVDTRVKTCLGQCIFQVLLVGSVPLSTIPRVADSAGTKLPYSQVSVAVHFFDLTSQSGPVLFRKNASKWL